MSTVHVVLLAVSGVLTALVLVGAGGSKIAGKPAMRESAEHFSIPWNQYRLIGFAEIAGAVGILVGIWLNGLGLVAGIAVVALMVGAVAFHVRAGDAINGIVPAIVALAISAVYVVVQAFVLWG